jgi:hypothetical protein
MATNHTTPYGCVIVIQTVTGLSPLVDAVGREQSDLVALRYVQVYGARCESIGNKKSYQMNRPTLNTTLT